MSRPIAEPETIKKIISFIEGKFGFSFAELQSRKQTSPVVLARSICMNLLYFKARLTQTEIGRIYGRDHSTIAHAIRKYTDMNMREVIGQFEAAIRTERDEILRLRSFIITEHLV